MRQGDVCWVRLPKPAGRRPALILTRSSAIGYLRAVTVAEITTTIRGAPTEVLLDESDGMPQRCAISADNVQTIVKGAVDGQITHLGPERMRAVRAALEFALGFDEIG